MRRPRTALAVAAAGLLLTACGSNSKDAADKSVPAVTQAPAATPTPTSAAVDPASVNANELGMVPVFMYHQLKANPSGGYDQTPEHFKAEVQTLYDMGFRPITAADLVAGKVDIAAGKHPMVMTFDDATVSQAGIGPDGNPKPDTALGILEDFGKAHPDFHPTASFYVNDSPFQDPAVLPWLVKHGYEIGVHTKSHANLKSLDEAGVQKEVGGNYAAIEAAVPGYKITTMALPFGVSPVNRVLAYKGTHNGTSYDMAGVMLVGSDPSVSPYAKTFDPLFVHRIRSGPGGVLDDSDYWIAKFKANPSMLYVSDGNPDKISFPSSASAKLSEKFSSQANPYGSSASLSPSAGATSDTSATHSPTHSPTPRTSHRPTSDTGGSGSGSSGSGSGPGY